MEHILTMANLELNTSPFMSRPNMQRKILCRGEKQNKQTNMNIHLDKQTNRNLVVHPLLPCKIANGWEETPLVKIFLNDPTLATMLMQTHGDRMSLNYTKM